MTGSEVQRSWMDELTGARFSLALIAYKANVVVDC